MTSRLTNVELKNDFVSLMNVLRNPGYIQDGIRMSESYPDDNTVEKIDLLFDKIYTEQENIVIQTLIIPKMYDRMKNVPHDIRYKYFRHLLVEYLKNTDRFEHPDKYETYGNIVSCYSRINDFMPFCSSCGEVLDIDIMFFLLQYVTIGDIIMLFGDRQCTQNHISKILGIVYNPISKPSRDYPSDIVVMDKNVMDY